MPSSFSYLHLAPVYEQLFPLDELCVSFVEQSLGGLHGKAIVDAGCGTGLLAERLASLGAKTYGFDLDPDLLSLARRKARANVSFGPGDLRTWVAPSHWSSLDAVTCFGNTVAHLLTEGEVEAFLAQSKKPLSPQGVLLLQILDYDWLESNQTMGLPDVHVEEVVFRRWYEINSSQEWFFHTELVGPGGATKGRFSLRPWRRRELDPILRRVGFSIDGWFGGFDGRPAGASLPLVLRARLA